MLNTQYYTYFQRLLPEKAGLEDCHNRCQLCTTHII